MVTARRVTSGHVSNDEAWLRVTKEPNVPSRPLLSVTGFSRAP